MYHVACVAYLHSHMHVRSVFSFELEAKPGQPAKGVVNPSVEMY